MNLRLKSFRCAPLGRKHHIMIWLVPKIVSELSQLISFRPRSWKRFNVLYFHTTTNLSPPCLVSIVCTDAITIHLSFLKSSNRWAQNPLFRFRLYLPSSKSWFRRLPGSASCAGNCSWMTSSPSRRLPGNEIFAMSPLYKGAERMSSLAVSPIVRDLHLS